MNKFVIIDGNALVHRAFHALPLLTAKDGRVVNALYGFASIIFRLLREIKPTHAAAAFDLAAPTFRHKEYKEYKATRVKQPQELYDQIPLVKELLRAIGVAIFEKEGYEADDIIATLAAKNKKSGGKGGVENLIVTGDMDTLQLIDKNTKVYTLKKGVNDVAVYDEEAVRNKFGLLPGQMADYKALRGDPSDNIPGIKGIGEKTAAALIKRFGSVEKMYEEIERGFFPSANGDSDGKISESALKKIKEGKKEAYFSKHLVELIRNVPLDFDLENCRLGNYQNEEVEKLLRQWEFKSLLKRLGTGADAEEDKPLRRSQTQNNQLSLC